MFSVLWSDTIVYTEKPRVRVIVSPVVVQLPVESQPVKRKLYVRCSDNETVNIRCQDTTSEN
jgi:hypothetical protein